MTSPAVWRHLQGFFGDPRAVALVTAGHRGETARWLADLSAMLNPAVIGCNAFTDEAEQPDGILRLRAGQGPVDVNAGFDVRLRNLTAGRVAWLLAQWDEQPWTEVKPTPWALMIGQTPARLLEPAGGGPPLLVAQHRWAHWCRPFVTLEHGAGLRFWAAPDRQVIKVATDDEPARTVGYVMGVKRHGPMPALPALDDSARAAG